MNKSDIIAKLQPIFDSVFLECPRLTADTSASDVPEWDSLTHISLMISVEKAFGIRFRTAEVEATNNIGEFAELILRRLSEK